MGRAPGTKYDDVKMWLEQAICMVAVESRKKERLELAARMVSYAHSAVDGLTPKKQKKSE